MRMVFTLNATHKTPEVKTWLTSHPRFKLHFTPTSASWLNLAGGFFAEITSRRIRRGSCTSVDDLEATIYDYLAPHNAKPKPFTSTKTAEASSPGNDARWTNAMKSAETGSKRQTRNTSRMAIFRRGDD